MSWYKAWVKGLRGLSGQGYGLQDYLDLFPSEFRQDSQQRQLIREVVTQLQQIEQSSDAMNKRKLLVIISGGPGTGKSVVAETILTIWSHMCADKDKTKHENISYNDYGVILLEGQTFRRRKREIATDLKPCLDLWSGKVERQKDGRVWERDIVVVDEAHRAPPFRDSEAGKSFLPPRRVTHNRDDLERRRQLVADFTTDALLSRTREHNLQHEFELLLVRAAQEARKCLIVVRDANQVYSSLAMTNWEFAQSVSAILGVQCSWDRESEDILDLPEETEGWHVINRKLSTQHRTSENWAALVRELLSAGEVNLEGLKKKYDAFFGVGNGFGRFSDELPNREAQVDANSTFEGFLMNDAEAFMEWVERQQRTAKLSAEAHYFRVLATFSWANRTRIQLDELSGHVYGWAPDAYPVNANVPLDSVDHSGKIDIEEKLADWPRKDQYDVNEDGVGYNASCQNQDFTAVGVIIGPHLRWQPSAVRPGVGRWLLNETGWQEFQKSSKRVQAQLQGDDSREQLLEMALSEAFILLTRPINRCGVYFCDPAARDALKHAGFEGVDGAY